MKTWLETGDNGDSNLHKVIRDEKVLIVSLFCLHNWANIRWRLKVDLKNDTILKKIEIYYDYEIQNHPSFLNQKLNFAYPRFTNSKSVMDYLDNLQALSYEEHAFRKNDKPTSEQFFSSSENRVRFEEIILHKGIELLNKAASLKANHRPLGATFPSYKTLGMGTLFFTWRNVSNTSPVVFWWDAGVWSPLFPLFKRGIGNINLDI